jgi:magnesium chelatase accessory protein
LLSRLPQLQQPVTLVTTAHDRTVPPTSAQSALQLLPQAKLLALPQGGHLAHEEDPQAFAHRIDEWIQSLTTQAGKVSEAI